jgi:hypothetical protein
MDLGEALVQQGEISKAHESSKPLFIVCKHASVPVQKTAIMVPGSVNMKYNLCSSYWNKI